jgi:hypothetical protein
MENHTLALAILVTCLGFVSASGHADEFEKVDQLFQSRLDARTNEQLSVVAHQALDEQIQALRVARTATEARVASRPTESAPDASRTAAADPINPQLARKIP